MYNIICEKCQIVALSNTKFHKRRNGGYLCSKCKSKKESIDQMCLPTWKDSTGNLHFGLPPELRDLTEAEKLLISRTDLYVPLHHLRGGQLAVKGHVCAMFKV